MPLTKVAAVFDFKLNLIHRRDKQMTSLVYDA